MFTLSVNHDYRILIFARKRFTKSPVNVLLLESVGPNKTASAFTAFRSKTRKHWNMDEKFTDEPAELEINPSRVCLPVHKVLSRVSDKFATRSNLFEGAAPTISPSKWKTPSCRNRHGVWKHASCSTIKLLEASFMIVEYFKSLVQLMKAEWMKHLECIHTFYTFW